MTPQPAAVTVLVVEDDPGQRDAFADMVRGAAGLVLYDAVGSLGAARRALEGRSPPDVVVLDLGLTDGDGTQLLLHLRQQAPDTAVLVATVFGDEGHVIRALEAGAGGYLLKDSTPAEFERALRLVHEGSAPLSPKIASHLLRRFAAPRPPAAGSAAPQDRLTARETQILTLVAQGYMVPEVARSLHLSAHTVTTHIKHIYEKLDVNNRVQAVNRARATGQIE